MSDITILHSTQEADQSTFQIALQGHEFIVHVSDDYYQQLTNGQITREQLVQKSFKFLLEREPVTSILTEFDLPTIQTYFPEYETEISKQN